MELGLLGGGEDHRMICEIINKKLIALINRISRRNRWRIEWEWGERGWRPIERGWDK